MTFLFNTSFHIHPQVEKDFVRWAEETYMPAVKASGLFDAPVLLEILTATDGNSGSSYCIQMFSSEPDRAMAWLDDEAAKLRAELIGRHGAEKMLHFTTAMRVMAGR